MSVIEVKHLSKTFQQKDLKVDALSDINLSIEKGDIYGIIGMSGAGKSTLVRCLNFLERPSDGQVLIDGQDLGALDEKQLRAQRMKIAMIFQKERGGQYHFPPSDPGKTAQRSPSESKGAAGDGRACG